MPDLLGKPEMRSRRLLAGASGGGHWIELMRLRPAFEGFEVSFVSTFPGYREIVPGHRYYAVPDASRFQLVTFLPIFWRALRIVIYERPDAIVTTGSAPMLPFVFFGRLFGAKTLWIDSIASSEHLSTSGRIAKRLAGQCISQWPDVASAEAIEYWGKVA